MSSKRLISLLQLILLLKYSYSFSNKAIYNYIPENFYRYSHYVINVSKKLWKDLLIYKGYLMYIFAQIEQETCISLRHKKCWSPYAELKTKREYGFGFGQITITKRYNNFIYFKKLFRKYLYKWNWKDRYNPYYQSLTLILYDKYLFRKVYNLANDNYNRFCFMLSSYNGGFGWLLKDILYCKRIKSCNPKIWFNNVEKYSIRRKYKIYKRLTSFDINRIYVKNIMKKRYKKYINITYDIITCILKKEKIK